LVVPESQLDSAAVITEISFIKAPAGDSSVLLQNFRIAFTQAASDTVESGFAENTADNSPFKVVFAGSQVTAADNGDGRIRFVLDAPYIYTGGDLLVDVSYTSIRGSMYVWCWNSPVNCFLSANSTVSASGFVSSSVPVIVLTW
jgi:hypothetical protein